MRQTRLMVAALVGVTRGIERLRAALYTRLMINQTNWVSLARLTKQDLLKRGFTLTIASERRGLRKKPGLLKKHT